MTKEEVMLKHCVPTGVLDYGKGRSIINAMEEYAKQKAWEAFKAAIVLTCGLMSRYGLAKAEKEFEKHWEENK